MLVGWAICDGFLRDDASQPKDLLLMLFNGFGKLKMYINHACKNCVYAVCARCHYAWAAVVQSA